jgi:hypothetical protein
MASTDYWYGAHKFDIKSLSQEWVKRLCCGLDKTGNGTRSGQRGTAVRFQQPIVSPARQPAEAPQRTCSIFFHDASRNERARQACRTASGGCSPLTPVPLGRHAPVIVKKAHGNVVVAVCNGEQPGRLRGHRPALNTIPKCRGGCRDWSGWSTWSATEAWLRSATHRRVSLNTPSES